MGKSVAQEEAEMQGQILSKGTLSIVGLPDEYK